MRTMMILSLLVLAGCATRISEPVPFGKDSYLLSVSDDARVKSKSELGVMAARSAGEFCAGSGKVLRVRNTKTEGGRPFEGQSASIVFSCIDETDRENTRPNMRTDPQIVIQGN